jgi:hypothetical protein
LEEQLENFKHLNIQNANSINELWDIFAKNCNWKYLTEVSQVNEIIDNAWDNDIITIFTAWDLDYHIRK